MHEIVVISGKGGTGKTSLTASFAFLAGESAVVVDCDVDAADLHLLLKPDFHQPQTFFSGEVASIDRELCTGCNLCKEVCRFDAIHVEDGTYTVDPIACEGCGYCARVCPVEAITNSEQNVGRWFKSKTRLGSNMVHAHLSIGAENSGKLVAKVKNEAKSIAEHNHIPIVLVDGAPGVGCPVVSSLSGASSVVLVTEPTVSGLHDLKRVHELVMRFGIPSGCIINKSGLNPEKQKEIRAFLSQQGITLLGEIPYTPRFTQAMTRGLTLVEWDEELGNKIRDCWQNIKNGINTYQELL